MISEENGWEGKKEGEDRVERHPDRFRQRHDEGYANQSVPMLSAAKYSRNEHDAVSRAIRGTSGGLAETLCGDNDNVVVDDDARVAILCWIK